MKAIHNASARWDYASLLFAISQRYYIESNSQQERSWHSCHTNCLLSRKDTTLKAIHNHPHRHTDCGTTVCYLAKILHWKQFTTQQGYALFCQALFAISQRYYIESNSQLGEARRILQATVCYLAKILHWKQFTTQNHQRCYLLQLFAISQRYYIESNSQHCMIHDSEGGNCLLSRKDTTLKAIHNALFWRRKRGWTVCYLAKILHWKQFTTCGWSGRPDSWLFAISQRYYIESNSQRKKYCGLGSDYCLLSRKDTTLKAIHNIAMIAIYSMITVCYLAKILHWKQFTTELTEEKVKVNCLLSRKDTTLKAIHNPM